MNPITSFLHNQMRNKNIGLVLLKIKVINLLGRYSLIQTQQIITRSSVRSATKTSPNLRLNPPEGEDQPEDLRSEVFVYGRLHPDGFDEPPPVSILNFDDLLGRTILLPFDENGERKVSCHL